MRTNFFPQIFLLTGLSLLLSLASCAPGRRAASRENTTVNTSSEKEIIHVVQRDSKLYELKPGTLLAAFRPGGEKETQLEDFMQEQKVAGIVVLQDGKLLLQRYSLGHSDTALWSSLSVAKSVTGTLVGAAIKDGYIKSVDDLVTNYVPDLTGSAYDSVTIRHLLTMTAGVKWTENYTDSTADIARFDYAPVTKGMNATVSYMRSLPAEAEPGTKWVYSTGETHLLGVVLSSATHQTLSGYLSSKIWKPYGMEKNATWILDRTGHEMAGCCLQMTTRDFARFGQFMLEGGRIDGKSILPEGWIETATKIQVPLWPGGGYGYSWWIFDDHSYKALGIHGQLIHVDPSRKLVVAINSAWPEADSEQRQFAMNAFINKLAAEIDKEQKKMAE